jgi:uncharacterized protein YrzB (UPF0473 family)
MEELENGKIKITNDKGEELVCDVLFTFDSDETHKSYIAYTDNTTDENGNIKVYANTYDPTGESLALEPLTEEKEWKVIENILMSVQEKVREAAAEEAGTNEAE